MLVLGATGTVGRQVVRLLQASGAPVRAAARPGFDLLVPATWDAALAGVRTMFLVRPPQLGRVRRDVVPFLDRARRLGVRHVVLLSLQGVDRLPVTPHARLENWLRSSGLDWTFVRPSFFVQNLSGTHAADIRDRAEIVVPAGDGRTAFVDAHDVAAVAAAALLDPAAHAGRSWTPTGPQALTYAEVADILTDVLAHDHAEDHFHDPGRPVRYTRPGLLEYARHARTRLGMPPAMVAVTAAIYTSARLGLAAGLTDDVRIVTGRRPADLRAVAVRERAAWQPRRQDHPDAGATPRPVTP